MWQKPEVPHPVAAGAGAALEGLQPVLLCRRGRFPSEASSIRPAATQLVAAGWSKRGGGAVRG